MSACPICGEMGYRVTSLRDVREQYVCPRSSAHGQWEDRDVVETDRADGKARFEELRLKLGG